MIANGSRKAKRIHEDTFLNMISIFPDKIEQAKIASIIKSIDNAINLQQRQLDLYKKLKQGLLQKLFPSDGEKVPVLRFDDFHEDWEQVKLNKLVTVSTGKAFKSNDFDDNGKYLVVTNKNVSDQNNGIKSNGDHITISNNVFNKYGLFGENILITMDGVNIGKVGMYSNDKAVLAQRVGRLTGTYLPFTYQLINNYRFVSRMKKLSVGNAIKHISLKQISTYLVNSPKGNNEKEKIGNIFRALELQMNLGYSNIEKLKRIKNYYLQNLFI